MARQATPEETAKIREMMRSGASSAEIAKALSPQEKADQAENANVAKAKGKGKAPAPKAHPKTPKKGRPPAAARVARQAGSRFTSSARASATAPIAAAGSVFGAFVVAFAAVLMLSILVIPRAGGYSGAGAVGALLGAADSAMSGLSNSEPFFKEVSS